MLQEVSLLASNTTNLNLYKKDPIADKDQTFNITTMMNENWDKIDQNAGQTATQLAQKAKITLSATEPAVKDINTYWYEDLGESIELGGGGGLIMGNAGLTSDNQIWLDTNI